MHPDSLRQLDLNEPTAFALVRQYGMSGTLADETLGISLFK